MNNLFALILVITTVSGLPMQACPSSPNCVSSQATDSHFIEPFSITGEAKTAFERLRVILEKRTDTDIIAADNNEIRVEFKTSLGFVDDGLFVLDTGNRVIQVRSASRAGYWDLGKNRRRLEEIRREFE